MTTAILDKPKARVIGKANLDNRLNAAELKAAIHESKVATLAIEMARTGRRAVYDEELDDFIWEDMSEAAHVDMIKFIVKKVLPDCQEKLTVEEKSLDKWAALIAAQPVEG